jgi:3-oxoacyl-(acyl-carrier-protein) synthase
MSGRFVISGIGVVAPTGTGQAAHWKSTLDRRDGLRPLHAAPNGWPGPRVAGVISDFQVGDFVPERVRAQTDRWTWLGLAAAELALSDAAITLPLPDPVRFAVLTSAASGGNEFGQREIQALWSKGPRAVSAYQSIAWFYAALSGQLSIRYGITGRCGVSVAEGAGGLNALAAALRLLRRDEADRVLVGGAEAPLSPFALACHSLDALSPQARADSAYLPFTAVASGAVPGEGGAMLVIEDADTARERGAQVYAELASVACTHDAHHPQDPPPDPDALAAAMRMALDRAGATADHVDVVFADACGDARWDCLEREALRAVFGARMTRLPMAVPKTLTGRLGSAGATLDLSWAALALFNDIVPPSAKGMDHAGGTGELDVVATPRRDTGLRTALVVARGSGGFNAAAILRAPGGSSWT